MNSYYGKDKKNKIKRLLFKCSISIDEAKEVHTMLRRAAGVFTFVQTEFLPQLANPPILGSDLDPRIINAYINQCTAEAQEGIYFKTRVSLQINKIFSSI